MPSKKKNLRIGLDGKYLSADDEIFVVGEVKERQFIGVTKGNSQKELVDFLRKNLLEKGKTIEAWCIDMSTLLKGTCLLVSPKSPIIADCFHVICFVNDTIDLCRIAVEKRLKERFQIKRLLLMKTSTFHKLKKSNDPKWIYKVKYFKKILKEHQEIKILWDLKNKVHNLYKCKGEESSEKAFDSILDFLEKHQETHPEFKDLRKTFKNWQEEILNYFKYNITNGYIEGLNNKIETLKRKKCGYRNKEKFLKALTYALFPMAVFFAETILAH